MKKRFKAVSATLNTDSDGEAFSEEHLKEMEYVPPQYGLITEDFNPNKPIGKVESAKFENGVVTVDGFIDHGYEGCFIVPGGICKRDDNGKLEKVIVNQYGCATDPTDESLTPLEYIGEIEGK